MSLGQAHRIHPGREPGRSLHEGEVTAEVAHRPEAREVHEVDSVVLREGWDVTGPPAAGAGESVHQDDGLSFPGHLVADPMPTHLYLAFGELHLEPFTRFGSHTAVQRPRNRGFWKTNSSMSLAYVPMFVPLRTTPPGPLHAHYARRQLLMRPP